jgi:putative phosphoesterase
MRIAVVSDIHSNLEALEAVLGDMPEVDKVLCAGDLVGYGADAGAVVDEVREQRMECVKGNHDEKVVTYQDFEEFNRLARKAITHNRNALSDQELEYLAELPEKKRIEAGNRDLFMIHGSPRNPLKEYLREEDVDQEFLENSFKTRPEILVMGHTHQPFVKKLSGTLILNPGSVGQPRDRDPRASYATLETREPEVKLHRAGYSVDKAAEKIRKEVHPLLADRLEKGM